MHMFRDQKMRPVAAIHRHPQYSHSQTISGSTGGLCERNAHKGPNPRAVHRTDNKSVVNIFHKSSGVARNARKSQADRNDKRKEMTHMITPR